MRSMERNRSNGCRAGVEHQRFYLCFVLLAQLSPVLSPQQIPPEGIRTEAGSHGWQLRRIKGLGGLPFRRPWVTGQPPQWSGLGFAARDNHFIGAPEPPLAKLQMLQFFGSWSEGAEQLESKPPARVREGLHHGQDVWHGHRCGDRPALP